MAQIRSKPFGVTKQGANVTEYILSNPGGLTVSVLDYGCIIKNIIVPAKNGPVDVVLGHDTMADYEDDFTSSGSTCCGAFVGRYANRIENATFSVGGKTYQLEANNGPNHLHGCFSRKLYRVKAFGDTLLMEAESPDGEDGFPGNFTLQVTYTLTEENTLRLAYRVDSDRDTVANPTNHVYFNLSCNPAKTIEGHVLTVHAHRFTETDDDQLPTGELGDLTGTMMDFSAPHPIGERIDAPFRAVIPGIGYDNNFCLTKANPRAFAEAAVLWEPESGRRLSVWTDLPGVQVYCGGWLKKDGNPGKGDSKVTYRRGVALETQFYPDSLHCPNFPVEFVKAGVPFTTTTEFRFDTK